MKLSRTFKLALGILLLSVAGVPRGFAAFDPVGEDIDIFLANPAVTAQRPNVLLMLDNTANWNQAFVNEKSALVTVVTGLTSEFNVGLMFFNRSAGGEAEPHGAFVKFGVRQMLKTNQDALSNLVNNLDPNGDQGNANVISEMINEAYRYWAGLPAYRGFGQTARDYPGNLANPYAKDLPGNAFASGTSQNYISPITDGCQKNFQIFISNGPANENTATLADMQEKLALLVGKNPPDTIPLANVYPDSNQQQPNWMDEYARYMSKNDCNANIGGVQRVITYVVEIDPKLPGDTGFTGGDDAMTTLMKSVASNGEGRYFSVRSANGGAEIIDALNQIFQEIQAKNTVFASTTLPVSVNVRGTNLNQVYIGVFRPDANKAPRWFGNLKLYNLQVQCPSFTSTTPVLTDANCAPAADSQTGFTKNSALSFWTSPSSFWSFRSPFPSSDVGMASDSPDGDLVEKGGAAERLRIAYATDQSTRKLYTCTGSCLCSGNSCTTPVALADSPFAISNAAIEAVALGTLVTKPVTSLTSLGNTATAVVTAHGFAPSNTIVIAGASPAVYNGSFTPITVIDANRFSYTLPSSPSGNAATVLATAHGLNTNDLVDVSGASESGYNVTDKVVTKVDANSFNYTLSAAVTAASSGHTVVGKKLVQTLSGVGTTATAVVPGHGYPANAQVTITGATPTEFNVVNASITVTGTDTFTYTTPALPGSSTTARGTTTSPHNFNVGDVITVNCALPLAYNNGPTGASVTQVIDASTFQYTLGGTVTTDATFTSSPTGCSTATTIEVSKAGASANAAATNPITHTNNSNTATVTTSSAHPFQINQTVTIAGATQSIYNGVVTILTKPSATTFTYAKLNAEAGATPLNPASATATVGSVTRSIATVTHPTTGNQTTRDTATVTTGSPHNFNVKDTVTIAGTNTSAYDGSWTITEVPDNTTFKFVNSGIQGAVTPATGTITITGAVTRSVSTLRRAVAATGTVYANRGITVTSITSQNNATGTITAANAAEGDSTARDQLIKWVRGQDNKENENSPADSSFTDVRASVHGDVLHSRPAVVNYNRGGDDGSNTGDNDVFAFYGGNDGVLHAVQGGFASNGGNEIWGFVAPEFFSKLKRLRDNTPLVGATTGTSSPRDYFFDGPIGVYTLDVNRDGKLLATAGDKVYLFVGMRRGGRYLYALDVSDPANPKFMWKRGCPNLDNNTGCDSGFEELGQTWSEPKVGFLKAYSNPVLFFGAGYDPKVEDFQPCLVTASTATSVTAETGGSVTYTTAGSCTYSGTTSAAINRSMGRGVFIVDATNGDLLFRFGKVGSGANKEISGMDYAIPSDVVLLNRDNDSTRTLPGVENIQPRLRGYVDRIYAVDTGGNVWRMDVDSANPVNWVVTKFASLSGSAISDKRKFLFSPDVVLSKDAAGNFDAVLLGTGDREHPFDATVTNRFYMLKDRVTGLDATGQATIVDATFDATTYPNGLFDATNNCLQDTAVCAAGSTARQDAVNSLAGARGWKITLLPGEKNVGTATTLAGTTYFNTNQPTGSASGASCESNLGVARQYAVSFADATVPPPPPGVTGGITAAYRSTVVEGGGYLPSPVPLIVEIGGKKYQAVISGTQLQTPGGLTLGARIRTYWYRKLE